MGILDTISKGHSILVFDCEFWHVMYDNEVGISPIKKNSYYFLPREVGGFLLTKDKTWKVHKPFFATMDSPSKNTSLPLGKFSSVGAQTAIKLSSLEQELGKSLGEMFLNDLSTSDKKLWKQALSIYRNDSNIKTHHKPPSWMNQFMKLYSTSVIVVKGSHDITALKNFCTLKGIQYKPPIDIIDIVTFNAESHDHCGSAKLEETYNCIKDDLSAEIKIIEKQLKIEEAHDPVTDASMTLIVAMYMMQ